MGKILLHQIPEATRAALVRLADRPLTEQAQKLGLTRKTIQSYRSVMIRAGLLAPRYRALREDDAGRIARLAALGYNAVGIAGYVGISERRVRALAQERKIVIGAVANVWTAQGAAALFDVTDKIVRLWRRQGWLDAAATSGDTWRHGVRWAITRVELQRFLHERRAWPTYEARLITDPELRALATRLRELAGGRWVNLQQLAGLAGVVPTAAARRIARGWLDGWEDLRLAGQWYFWWPDGASLPVYVERDRWAWRRQRQEAA